MLDIKFFALMYLNDWYWWDKPFIERLQRSEKSERLKAIHDAAKFYKVARNFKKLKEKNRLEHALDYLECIQGPIDANNVNKTFSELSDSLKSKYGKNATSASSKFLWLRFKSPVVIYDSRALGGLTAKGFKPLHNSYASYRESWLNAFNEKADDIRAACSSLHSIKEYSHANLGTDNEIKKLVSENWFQERVFDKYLWFYGNDG